MMLRQAAAHWEAALAVNPLHAEGWFALGFCALKGADAPRAAQAFTRAAQQDPDNGEAWNNLAAVHLQARALLELHRLMLKPISRTCCDSGHLAPQGGAHVCCTEHFYC